MFAKMLLVSDQFNCSEEAMTITAMLQVQNIWLTPGVGQRAQLTIALFETFYMIKMNFLELLMRLR